MPNSCRSLFQTGKRPPRRREQSVGGRLHEEKRRPPKISHDRFGPKGRAVSRRKESDAIALSATAQENERGGAGSARRSDSLRAHPQHTDRFRQSGPNGARFEGKISRLQKKGSSDFANLRRNINRPRSSSESAAVFVVRSRFRWVGGDSCCLKGTHPRGFLFQTELNFRTEYDEKTRKNCR